MMSLFSRTLNSTMRTAFVFLIAVAFLRGRETVAGTWRPLANLPPSGVNLMVQLPDGTVMCARNNGSVIGNLWYRLTPDATGSYVNGTWTTLAAMHDTRLYYPSQVLRDGRLFVAGGEYGTGGPRAEVYDPLSNVWTQLTIPASLWNPASNDFYDCNSEILPNGNVLLMPVFPHSSGIPLIYDPVANAWSNAGRLFRGSYQDEASWVKLPDDSILTIDPFGTFSERYIPSTNTWVNDGVVPVSLYDPYGFELGAGVLLHTGKAFFLGSTGHTALYTPSGTTSPGTWVAGPDIPGSRGTPDAPAAVMVTGNVLCAVSPVPTSGNHFPSPTTFYEYDPVANSFISVGAPVGSSDNIPTYQEAMLDLPDGSVLYSHFARQLYVYMPSGAPLAIGKPTINSITPNGDGSYHLIGTKLNGISEGASYGDDLQMNSNYPLVRLTADHSVYYARTYNWSRTSVQTGSAPVSTEFVLPAGLPPGDYSLEVVANGNPSDPVAFSTCSLLAVNPISDESATCGAFFSSAAPGTSSGSMPITWSLDPGAPDGMVIDSGSGVVSWPNPVAIDSPYSITTRATNGCSNDSETWNLTVSPDAPTIDFIADAHAVCGAPYTSSTPSTSGGVEPLNWSLISGPPGMTINALNGTVSWPSPTAAGSPFTISVQAASTGNCGDSAPLDWQLSVVVGDFTGDGLVTEADIPGFVDDLLPDPGAPICAGDLNGDGVVDGLDIAEFDVALGV